MKTRGPSSVLDELYQSGSLKVLFPRRLEPGAQAVLINTAGGITGGDRFALNAGAGAGTSLTLTTQAAERAYRAQPGEVGQVRNCLTVKAGARLNWVPQETILFNGCALDRSLHVDLAEDASLLLVEPLVFGRAASNEKVQEGLLHDRIEISRGGEVLFLDAMQMQGNIAAHLARPTIAAGAGALVSVVYAAPDAEAHLAPVRAMLPASAGASLIRDNLLFLRILAPDSHLLRTALIPVLTRLSGGPLPRPWMI